MLADAGVDDSRLVERAARLPHAFEAPVGRVVVRARHHVEADRLQILCNRRRPDDPYAAELRLRYGRRPRQIDCRALEVAERGIGVANDFSDRCEPRRLRHGTRDDVVADRGNSEAVGDAHQKLALRIARRRRLLRRDQDDGSRRQNQPEDNEPSHEPPRKAAS